MQVLPVNNTAAEEAPTLVLLADACNDAQAPSEHAEVSMKCKKGDEQADAKFMLMQAQEGCISLLDDASEGCRQARDDLGTTEDCASPQGYPNRPTVKTLHHLDHTYSSKESPRSKAKRLEGCLKEARKRIKVLEAKTNRHSERSRTLQNMIDEMRSKSLITEEAQTKLEQFGNLPVEILDNWRRNATEQPRGRRYSIEMKKFATTLHYYSPRAYDYVSSLFAMPSVQSIRQWLRVVGGWPGFTAEVLTALKEQHKKDTPRERLCSILLDGMSIKKACELDLSSGRLIGFVDLGNGQEPHDADNIPLATEALVFMVVGLAAPWKMPFGYFLNAGLSGEVIKNLLLEAVHCIQECGLKVTAIVCDCLMANVAMVKLLGCRVHELTFENLRTSFPNPQFEEEEIFVMFDPCHALKLLRNLLGDKNILWSETYGVSVTCHE